MVRTQVQLTEEQAAGLKELAARKHQSVAAVIREGIDLVLLTQNGLTKEERRQRALSAIGAFSGGPRDLARNHDHYFAEAIAGEGPQ